MRRTLVLRREALTALSPDELGAVAGAAITGLVCTPTVVISFLTFCAEYCPYSFPNC